MANTPARAGAKATDKGQSEVTFMQQVVGGTIFAFFLLIVLCCVVWVCMKPFLRRWLPVPHYRRYAAPYFEDVPALAVEQQQEEQIELQDFQSDTPAENQGNNLYGENNAGDNMPAAQGSGCDSPREYKSSGFNERERSQRDFGEMLSRPACGIRRVLEEETGRRRASIESGQVIDGGRSMRTHFTNH